MTTPKNAIPRAHVQALAPIAADPCSRLENVVRDDESEEIQTTTPLTRKEKRKKNQRNKEEQQLSTSEIDTPPPTDNDTEPDDVPQDDAHTSRPSDPDIPTPISRKALRAQKKRIANPPTPPPSSPTPSKPPPNNPRPLASKPPTLSPLPTLTMPPTTPYALLVASLGNPGTAYAHTFHSAGHIVTTHISTTKSYEPFTKGLSGLVSRPSNTTLTFGFLGFRKGRDNTSPEEDDWTFWQSTSLMNVSGPPLRRAWTEFSRGVKARGREPRLVVVHDELEAALGRVGVKDGGSSARGHNGLKSVQGALGVGTKWWRIGVGIGRPESREARVVSEYVLKKMSAREVGAVEKACVGVVEALREIGEGRR